MTASAAQPFWASLPLADRARYAVRAAQVVLDVSSELTAFLAREHGRTPAEAWALDLLPSVDGLHWAARAGSRALAPRRVGGHTALARARRARVVREPLGVVGVAGSDAAPWAEPLERIGVALMAGNGVLLAPSPAAERIVRIWARAGVPDGIVSLAREGELAELTTVWDDAAAGLEAKGPMLVRADADLDRAAAAAAWGAFAAGGRMAGGVAAAWVAAPVADAFAARVTARTPPGSQLAVHRVDGDEEAIAGAVASAPAGAASVWSRDRERARRVAQALPFPVVWVNDHANPIRARSYGRFEEATRPVVVATTPGRGLLPWWPPHDPGLPAALAAVGAALYGREHDRAAALRAASRPLGRLAARSVRRP